MITQDQIDKIQKLKAKRYSQSKVAKELHLSRSTVARYWEVEKKTVGGKSTSKKFGLDDLFFVSKCGSCGLIYPKPKFLPSWNCPGCKKVVHWKVCWYKSNMFQNRERFI
jgi:hypothetical protein